MFDIDELRWFLRCTEDRWHEIRGWARGEPQESYIRQEVEWYERLVAKLRMIVDEVGRRGDGAACMGHRVVRVGRAHGVAVPVVVCSRCGTEIATEAGCVTCARCGQRTCGE